LGVDFPLTLRLRRGLNILVGPNDAGKTAVIDAPRFLLWTRGDDYLRLEPSDFHIKPNGERVTELLIRCTFDGLSPDEEARFLEWCTNESGVLRLYVRIPIDAGRVFRREAGQRSEVKPDAIPI